MLNRPVIAADIENLTDARYFASWGVDYLMFDINNISIDKVKEITEWIEGVNALILLDHNNIHLVEEVILKLSPFAFGTADTFVLEKILTYVNEGSVFFQFEDKTVITDVENVNPNTYQIDPNTNSNAFVDIEPIESKFKLFLSNNDSSGIILRGSSEIETGLKSFENIDTLLETLL